MQHSGLVHRCPHPDDARSTRLFLTGTGRRAVTQVARQVAALDVELAALAEDPAALARFLLGVQHLAAIPAGQRAHFAYLGTYAIGMFLTAIGLLSLRVTAGAAPTNAAAFYGLMTVVWAGRVGLEWRYPTEAPIFGVSRPATGLTIIAALMAICYAIGGTDHMLQGADTRGTPNGQPKNLCQHNNLSLHSTTCRELR